MPTKVLKVDEENKGLRLDVFLIRAFPDLPSRRYIQELIENGCVLVNHRPKKAHYLVRLRDEVSVQADPLSQEEMTIQPENIPLEIFYEDEDIIVVHKPAGLLVHPAQGVHRGTLVNALLYHCPQLSDVNAPQRLGIVHRLDKETSGVMVVAKNNTAHVKLARQFENHTVHKRYIALVGGVVEFDEGLIEASLGRHPRHREKKAVRFDDSVKEAITFYHVLKRFSQITLLALFPKTGRTHQLRVHLSYLGHPILGDEKYGKRHSFPRLALHAQSLGFLHPRSLKYIEFSTRFPQDLLSPGDIPRGTKL
jgi:23S rRNA pseudouridine1911/1915/1917 synthase